MKNNKTPILIVGLCAVIIVCIAVFWPTRPPDDPLPLAAESQQSQGRSIPAESISDAAPTDQDPVATADPEHQPEADRTAIKDGTQAAINPEDAHLAVALHDDTGAPLANAKLLVVEAPSRRGYSGYGIVRNRLLANPELSIAQTTSNADGLALLAGLEPYTEYEALIQADGKASVVLQFQTEDLAQAVDIGPVPLGPSAAIQFEIREADGSPVVGMSVTVYADPIPDRYSKEFPPIEEQTAKTGADGIAHLNQLPQIPEFRYGYGGQFLSGEAKFEPIGEPSKTGGHLRVTLPEATWAMGRVVDTEGTPVAGAQITMERLSYWHGEDEPTVEELRLQGPSGLWGSHTNLGMYESSLVTDEQGNFKGKIPDKAHITPRGPDVPDMVSAIVLVGEDFGQCGTWFFFDEEIVIEVPILHQVSGRILDANGSPVAESQVVFHERLGPGDDPEVKKDMDYSYRFDSNPAACDQTGNFHKRLLPGHYWIEVRVPGGKFKFEGPYSVNAGTDIGTISLPQPRSVRLIAQSQNPELTLVNLEGQRTEQPEEEEDEKSLGGLFGGGKREPNTPWGDRDWAWARTNADAAILENVALWSNEPNGSWRYLLEAKGFVPAVVDLTLSDTSGNVEQTVSMEPTGFVRVHLSHRDGQPAKGIKVQLAPEADKPAHPAFEMLEETRGWYRDMLKEEIADESGIVRFKEVFPGSYEIIALEMTEQDSFFSPPADLDRPVLATFQVQSGKTTDVTASMAEMADLKVWVSHNGQLVADAEVFAIPKSDTVWKAREVLDPEVVGTTGEDGSFVVSSLVPGKAHWVGARLADGSRLYGIQNSWTSTEVTIAAGSQETTIELATGGVKLKVSSDLDISRGRVSLLNVGQSFDYKGELTERDQRMMKWSKFRAATEPFSTQIYSLKVAGRYAELNTQVEMTNVPPGTYRVVAEFGGDDNPAWGVSEPFNIQESIVDLGTLQIQKLVKCQFTVTGLPEPPDHARILQLFCFRPGESRAAGSAMWFRVERPLKMELPVGEYELALFQDQREIARSPTFKVVPIKKFEHTWTPPDVEYLPEE